MESLTSDTLARAGSFRCQRCGYVLTLSATDTLTDCPGCGGQDFTRASLFSTGRLPVAPEAHAADAASGVERERWLAEARARLAQAGEYLVYDDDAQLRTVALTREWTRIGRSLAADVRLDDPTVSRRHALIVRQDDGVRVLDDRSLNGVFVNHERVESRALRDGDELLVGRYRLSFLSVSVEQLTSAPGLAQLS
jgi:predicted RNA-binding Zn-ribbon protein involved in translation (DUF1610 family)